MLDILVNLYKKGIDEIYALLTGDLENHTFFQFCIG